ncbi:6-phosphogluconolactonase [Formosa algae]|uniref:Glucosamine-6-phosphate deaminase n=1 Tax=Formosa algae TaxID=225843 RepID=A0A9X1C8P0_9FLAO|nr:6-phosphogluconolactonase [Formosa algae]MBP1838788.1 glucosamine-6-phosphate deaminase [Formosa algae]MDQ0335288.1 glucosamine-6-phosphate deaminase [Formosa algae]
MRDTTPTHTYLTSRNNHSLYMLKPSQNINILSDKFKTGEVAGKAIEDCIVKLQNTQPFVRIIFAAAPSQDTMLDYLTASTLIDWNRIKAFNMDEYIGLAPGSEQLFSSYLERNLFSKVNIPHKRLINPSDTISDELLSYSKIIQEAPIDIVCLGIGENGHIAFNDPPVANFKDTESVKVVTLDHACRTQQVNDKCFNTIEQVPKRAITLTIPILINANHLFCVVLGKNKSEAVKQTLLGPITTACPASILKEHPNCSFYFDADAYSKINH